VVIVVLQHSLDLRYLAAELQPISPRQSISVPQGQTTEDFTE